MPFYISITPLKYRAGDNAAANKWLTASESQAPTMKAQVWQVLTLMELALEEAKEVIGGEGAKIE